MSWLILSLPVYILLDAWAQGKLNLLTREYVPPVAQNAVNLPLHRLYPICYCLLALVVAVATQRYYVAITALLLRVALFDVVLNMSKKDEVFALGTSATSDQLIRRLAKLLSLSPALANALVKLLALVLSVVTYCYL